MKPKEGLAGHPIVRRERYLGTLRSPKYEERRRQAEAGRLARRAAKIAKRLARIAKTGGRLSDRKNWRALEANASTWRKLAKRLNPPQRRGPVRLPKQPPLANQLARAQGVGKSWLPLITRLVEENWLVLTQKTDLRRAVANAIRPYNLAAANALAAGKTLYLPRGKFQLVTLLLKAQTGSLRRASSAKLKAQAKRARTEDHFREVRGW